MISSRESGEAAAAIVEKAAVLGASLAGLAGVEDLRQAPSFTFAPKMPGAGSGIGTRENKTGLKPGEAAWPEGARSVLVIAVAHPAGKPELDWWFDRADPPGNRILAGIVRELRRWISDRYGFATCHLPYHIEKGGTYLKDAAVLAGLGCIGRNNLLVTPQYGPRVRLRAMTLEADLPSSGPLENDPCRGCAAPCRQACPQRAFERVLYHSVEYGQDRLPGRAGDFSRFACNRRMGQDVEAAMEQRIESFAAPVRVVRYCRACELSCPVGG